jgi:hypothetical protein
MPEEQRWVGGWSSQDQALRADNRVDRAIAGSADPWHGCPVVETHYQLGLKSHSPGLPHHDPHKIGAVCRRHEIDNGCRAGVGLEFGFEDEGAGKISPSCGMRRMLWSNEPATIVGCSD